MAEGYKAKKRPKPDLADTYLDTSDLDRISEALPVFTRLTRRVAALHHKKKSKQSDSPTQPIPVHTSTPERCARNTYRQKDSTEEDTTDIETSSTSFDTAETTVNSILEYSPLDFLTFIVKVTPFFINLAHKLEQKVIAKMAEGGPILNLLNQKYGLDQLQDALAYVLTCLQDINNERTQAKDYGQCSLDWLGAHIQKIEQLQAGLIEFERFMRKNKRKSDDLNPIITTLDDAYAVASARYKILERAHREENVKIPAAFQKQFEQMQKEIKELKNKLKDQKQVDIRKRPPALTVQKFRGDKKDFIVFMTAFKSTYEDHGLSNIELAIHLGQNLEGEAKKKFGYMAATPDEGTYDTIWACLQKYYGTPEEQSLDKLEKFLKMPEVKTLNANTVSMLSISLQEHWVALKKALGDQFNMEKNYIFYTYLKKFPLHEQEQYKNFCFYSDRKQTFTTFREWLDNRWETLKTAQDHGRIDRGLVLWQDDVEDTPVQLFKSLEISDTAVEIRNWETKNIEQDESGNLFVQYRVPEDCEESFFVMNKAGQVSRINKLVLKTDRQVSRTAEDQPRRPLQSFPGTTNKNKPRKQFPQKGTNTNTAQCVCCNMKGHYIKDCDKFLSMGIKSRLETVQTQKLCFRCLRKDHLARDCKVKFLCDIDQCGRRHHRLLHTPKLTQTMKQYFHGQGLDSDLDESDVERSED